jgi:Zn ribbon nucleic-acid-binding protein
MTGANLCPNCGANAMVLRERRGHMEVYRCQACGWEAAGTSSPASEVPRLEKDLMMFRLRLATQQPGLLEAKVLRQLLPEYADRSIAELKTSLRQGDVVCTRPRRAAAELQRQARELGVELLLEELDGGE